MSKDFKTEMVIIIDSNETIPYKFIGYPIIFEKLAHADYSLQGFQDTLGIESKAQMEFYTWIGAHRERALEQLNNMKKMMCSAIIIESTFEELLHPERTGRSQLKSAHVLGFIGKVIVDYHVPILFSGSWKNGETLTLKILERFYERTRNGQKGKNECNREINKS